tara:strand:- start:1217 stop:2101 length:885 start_codon:yes stop_codon:yes gene_type:complete
MKHKKFKIKKTRIADSCICCGSSDISSSPAVLMPFIADRVFNWKPVKIDDSWKLSTINNGYAYSICNSLSCNNCDFLFLDIRFTDEEMASLYSNYREESYTKQRDFYEPGYADRNSSLNEGQDYTKQVESFLDPYLELPCAVLDWGGDTGKNTPFKNQNLTLDIYDISDKDVIEGAKRVTKKYAYEQNYDLIVCSNVFEHVSYPSDLLDEIIPCMNENTVLYIEVPFEDIMMKEDKKRYLHKKHWHEHINFYSEKSLELLLENFDLKIIELKKLKANDVANNNFLFQVACKLKQ